MAPKKLKCWRSQLSTSKETIIVPIFSDSKETGESVDKIFGSYLLSNIGIKLKWRLKIYPNGINEESKDFVSIFIELAEPIADDDVAWASCQFAIRDSNGLDKNKKVIDKCNFKGNNAGIADFIKRNELFDEENEINGRIVCEITVRDGLFMNESIDDFDFPKCQAMEDFGHLFEKSVFTDCRIVAGDGKEFKAHKCILSARSTVFARMFENPMLEAQMGIVKIEDIESAVLEQMLKFIYSGTVSTIKHIAKDLLVAADKYHLDRLKMLCERSLRHSMWNHNVCELLILANRHSAATLKADAIKRIQNCAKEVIETDGWKMLVNSNDNELMDEIVKAIVAFKY